MSGSNYKYFCVLSCTSTSVITPNKFISVPTDVKKTECVVYGYMAQSDGNITHAYVCCDLFILAEIGHFLKLTNSVLNVEEVCQYEVERMLLMPRESMTLMTLMTSMLSPEIKRPALDESPLMPYEVWTEKLSKKIEEWLCIFYKLCDKIAVFEQIGIEPYFWDVIGLVNPLSAKRFHEISFFQRCTNKSMQDLFSEESEIEGVRPTVMGRDKNGCQYITLPFFPEIRVYKEVRVTSITLSNWTTVDGLVNKLQKFHINPCWSEEERQINFAPPEEKFHLVAYNCDSLVALIEETKDNENFNLESSLTKYWHESKTYSQKCEGLKALYQQWHEFQKKPPEYFTYLLSLWLGTEKPVCPKKESCISENEIVLGKRRAKAVAFSLFDDNLVDSMSDDSDWEIENLPNKKKKSNSKKKSEPFNITNKNFQLSISKLPSQDDMQQELELEFEDHKPTWDQLNSAMIKLEAETNEQASNSSSSLGNAFALKSVESKSDDVISISSDDDKDDDVVISGTSKVNTNNLPPKITKKPVPLPMAAQHSMLVSQLRKQTSNPSQLETKLPVRGSPSAKMGVQNLPQNTSPQINHSPQPQKQMVSPIRNAPQRMIMQTPPHQQVPARSPRAPQQFSPRMRTPTPPRPRTPLQSPRGGRFQQPGSITPRALFQSPNRATPPVTAPSPPNMIEGMLTLGSDPDGTWRYRVKLSDGGLINLSRSEVEDIRRQHNGILPQKVNVPLIKRKMF